MNELKAELSKSKESYQKITQELNKKIEDLEKKLEGAFEKNVTMSLENETLAKDIVCFKERMHHLEEINTKLSQDNERCMRYIQETSKTENDSQKQVDKKMLEFQNLFTHLENQLKSLEQEVFFFMPLYSLSLNRIIHFIKKMLK